MRGFGRVLNPSLPVGSTPCKGSLGLLSAQTVGIAALSDPNSCPMSANYLQGHRSEAPGTSSQCKVDKLVNDQPAGDKHDTDQQQGTQDSTKLARLSPLLAYIVLALKSSRIQFWCSAHVRCIGRILNPARPVGPTPCKGTQGLALSPDSWNRSSVRPNFRPVGPTTCLRSSFRRLRYHHQRLRR